MDHLNGENLLICRKNVLLCVLTDVTRTKIMKNIYRMDFRANYDIVLREKFKVHYSLLSNIYTVND